jgi:acyl carrier protein
MENPPSALAERETALLAVLDALRRDLRAAPPPVTMASQLEQELGVDSLARTELNTRIARRFGVRPAVEAGSTRRRE